MKGITAMIVGTKVQWNESFGNDVEECVRVQKGKDGFIYWFQKEGEEFQTWLHEKQWVTLKEQNIVKELNVEVATTTG